MNTTTNQTPQTETTDQTRAEAAASRRRRLGRLATIAAAIVVPLLVWAIAVPLAGLDLVAGAGATAQTITPASIVIVGLVTGIAAWGFIALLERFTRHGRRTFAIVGWPLLALSLLGPVGAGASGGVLVALVAMHLVTGAALMIGMPLAARRAAVRRTTEQGR